MKDSLNPNVTLASRSSPFSREFTHLYEFAVSSATGGDQTKNCEVSGRPTLDFAAMAVLRRRFLASQGHAPRFVPRAL
jgi:hypothetical protein